MAGHSKWSKIKRFKGALDVKRGTLFSKLAKEIAIAARAGGGDFLGQFAEKRAAFDVERAFEPLNFGPLAVPGHWLDLI